MHQLRDIRDGRATATCGYTVQAPARDRVGVRGDVHRVQERAMTHGPAGRITGEFTELMFEPPCRLLTLNNQTTLGRHIGEKNLWLQAAWIAALAVMGTSSSRRARPPSLVACSFPVRAPGQRRDGHNYVATVKPIVDGLVHAGVWPDDNTDWVRVVDPVFHAARHNRRVTVRITPLEQP